MKKPFRNITDLNIKTCNGDRVFLSGTRGKSGESLYVIGGSIVDAVALPQLVRVQIVTQIAEKLSKQ